MFESGHEQQLSQRLWTQLERPRRLWTTSAPLPHIVAPSSPESTEGAMRRKTVVDDCWGVRWTVRAHRERRTRLVSEFATTERASLLLPYLGPAFAPEPGTHAEPALECGPEAAEREHLLNALAEMREAAALGGLIGRLHALAIGVGALTEPTDRVWLVELAAKGRIRRGATWRVAGRAEAMAVADTVADAVRRGHLPQPAGALLIDVVDQRLTVHGALR
jgi:hypothetical protein